MFFVIFIQEKLSGVWQPVTACTVFVVQFQRGRFNCRIRVRTDATIMLRALCYAISSLIYKHKSNERTCCTRYSRWHLPGSGDFLNGRNSQPTVPASRAIPDTQQWSASQDVEQTIPTVPLFSPPKCSAHDSKTTYLNLGTKPNNVNEKLSSKLSTLWYMCFFFTRLSTYVQQTLELNRN